MFAKKLIRQVIIRDRLDQQLRAWSADLARDNVGLQELAHTDKLTGIANRRRFDELLEHELRRAQRAGSVLSLILLDVDFFKKYNDHYGHPAGDAVLRDVGRILAAQVNRNRDAPARYGGEEFAVILPDTDAAGALAVAQRIRAEIQALQIAHQHAPLGVVTVSLGVAALDPQQDLGLEAADLVARADRCLYRAKHDGRNRVAGGPAVMEDALSGGQLPE